MSRRAPFLGAALALVLLGCGSGAPPYAECVDDLDCGEPSDACYEVRLGRTDGTEATGAFCSATCASDAECPEGGACIALAGDPTGTFFCADRCVTAADCYAPFACTTIEGVAAMQVCLP